MGTRHRRACLNETFLGKLDAHLLVQNVHGRRIGGAQQSFTVKEEVIKIADSGITQVQKEHKPLKTKKRGLQILEMRFY